MYDILIIGAGPAGLTAALYARRADKSVLVLEKETFGGQITYSPKVENIPGITEISGNGFAEKLMEQVLSLGAEIELAEVTGIRHEDGFFTVMTHDCDYIGKAVIIASGSRHRMLGVRNEEKFVGQGISFCAVCDGAFYSGKTVAVIGGGNSALQEAVMLSENCRKVYVVQNLDFLTGEGRLASILESRPNVEIIYGNTVDEILGEEELEGLVIKSEKTGEKSRLTVDGIFVAVGQVPENKPFEALVELDSRGYIVSGEACLTNVEGIFTAGDCRTKSIRQVTTACADGAVAALAACRYLEV